MVKILMAEDNELNLMMQKAILARLDYEVVTALNGQEACDLADSQDFDLILMDMQMPVMSGVEATKYLRSKGYDKPIIAMTANAYDRDREICLEAGMDVFIPKPIDVDQFEQIVQSALEGNY